MGFSLGEHLGFIFLACWGTGLCIFLYPYPHFPKWLIYLGISSSMGTFMGVLEGIGWELAANIVSICSSLLILWIILLGIFLGRIRAVKLDHTSLYRKIGEASFERVN